MSLTIKSVVVSPNPATAGETLTATVQYSGSAFVLTCRATVLGTTGVLDGTFTVLPEWTVTDDGGRTWTPVSDDGATATFKAVA